MTIHNAYDNGVLIEQWNTDLPTPIYTDFRTEPPSVRNLVPAEIALVNSIPLNGLAAVNRVAIRGDVAAQIDIIKAMIGTTADVAGTNTMRAIKNSTNATINAGPAPYIKALNQNQIDLAQAIVRLSRLVADVVGDISTAPL